MEQLPYDPGLVGDSSREFADILRAHYPEWASMLSMIREGPDEPWRVELAVPSPTGDEDRVLVFWMKNDYDRTNTHCDEPSIGFGYWHHHLGDLGSMEELLDLADAIRTDMKVEYFNCAWDSSHWWVLDDWSDEVFSELLNDPSWPGRIRVRSWGGTRGGEYSLDSLAKRPKGNAKEQD